MNKEEFIKELEKLLSEQRKKVVRIEEIQREDN